jgi:LysM repeat protein
VPSPYKPPLPRRAQAVQSARGRLRQQLRVWWLVPLLGLVPVVVAAVLASEGVFNAPPRQPVAATLVSATQAVAAAPIGATPAPTLAAAPNVTSTGAAVATQPTQTAVARTTTQSNVSPAAATTTTQTADNTTATGPFKAYRVQPGDTVRFVAEMYGVSTASIIQASGLQNPDRLRIGQVLTVPDQPGWLYRIQPGETLDLIAARTGVATDLIASASRLSNTSVRAGDVILIPDQTVARSK